MKKLNVNMGDLPYFDNSDVKPLREIAFHLTASQITIAEKVLGRQHWLSQ